MKSPILTIFLKELKDTFRDRRTLFTSVVLPAVVFPLIFQFINSFTEKMNKKAMDEVITVAVSRQGTDGQALIDMIKVAPNMKIVEDIPLDSFAAKVRDESLKAGLVIPQGFDSLANTEGFTDSLTLYLKTKSGDRVADRMGAFIEAYGRALMAHRLNKANVSPLALQPLAPRMKDDTSDREKIAKAIGGFLPYMFILFCFLGCMYPAIDLFSGEKERGTLETILTAPVLRTHILLGKLAVVMCFGLISVVLQLCGIYLAFSNMGGADGLMSSMLSTLLTPQNVAFMLLMLVPLTIFLASLLATISIYAKSYKEAISLASPMNFVLLVPVMLGMMPGVEYTFVTAITPVLNVSLATKEILAGTLNPTLFALTSLSLIALAGFAFFFCSKWYANEKNLMRV